MPVPIVIESIAAILLVVGGWRLIRAWWRYRGMRVITCPENFRPAGVQVDASHAAATAWGRSPDLRLASCSRWPERAGCGQQCLAEITHAPADCLVRNILEKWYAGK